MDPLVSNLLSGLVGAVVGALIAAFISMYIYYRSRLDAARQKLMGAVFRFGYQLWWNPDRGEPLKVLNENYPALWEAYADLRRCVPVWKQKGLDKAWQKYVKLDHYDEIPDEEVIMKVFLRGSATERQETAKLSD